MKTFALRARDYLDTPSRKRFYNERLFAEVAPKYDRVTRLLSLGRDGAWKDDMVAAIPGPDPALCLDLACGTGDLVTRLHRRYPASRVVGVDLSPEMLAIARARSGGDGVSFELGDMSALRFADHSVDLVTGGYALRNAPDIRGALREIRRVLRPGGYLALLDFSKSPRPMRAQTAYAILKSWGAFWGWALHGYAGVYGYIADSLETFPDRRCLREWLMEEDLRVLSSRTYFAGLLEWVVCRAGVRHGGVSSGA